MKQQKQFNLSQSLREGFRHLRLLHLLKNDFWAKAYSQYNLWPNQVSVDISSGCLTLKNTGIQLDQTQSMFLPSLQYVQPLLATGGRFVKDSAGNLSFEIDDLIFLIQMPADLDILFEVFACDCYRFKMAGDQQNLILWDVGMNVGIASLYFARNKAFDAVIGYEPFAPTFRQAERLFKLNPTFSNKIVAVNKGIGDRSETLTLAYAEQQRGSLNVFDRDQFSEQLQQAEQEMVQIEDAVQVLKRILEEYPGRAVIVKMDCEGGEHRILPALSQAKMLHHIKALLLEWHGPNAHHLEQLLVESGFSIFSVTVATNTQGYIYAIQMSDQQSLVNE